MSGVEKMIGYEKFVVRGSGGRSGDLVRWQLLAWAMSVHNSQVCPPLVCPVCML